MQTTKVDVNKQIQIAVRTGKVSLGIKEALDAARSAKGKLLIVASNCPEPYKTSLLHYAKQSGVPVFNYSVTSLDLGAACGKLYLVSALTIREAGDSEILKLAAQ